MGDSNTITVSTELGDVVVRKMPLADYAELLRALDKLPENTAKLVFSGQFDFGKMENAEILALVPELLANSWEDVAALIAVPTDRDAEFMLKIGGPEAFEVIDSVLELNDFARIAATIKKIVARGAKKKTAKPVQPK